MLGQAWLTLRQAQEALRSGRLEEAQRLLDQPAAQGHKHSQRLLPELGRGFAERGERNLRHENLEAAWEDLLQAEKTGASVSRTAGLRQRLMHHGLAQVRRLLQAGDSTRAMETIERLHERKVASTELQLLEDATRSWIQAELQASRGEYGEALRALDRARGLLSEPLANLEALRDQLESRRQEFGRTQEKLHEAMSNRAWREVLGVAEAMLSLAPQNEDARKARSRAWHAIQPPTTPAPASDFPEAAAAPSDRYLLWIDGVGGFLVCLDDRVVLGQGGSGSSVHVPLFADVGREHAAIRRDHEGYILEALRPTQVNGTAAQQVPLRTGDRVTLGNSCQFLFHQSVPVSTSARLELVSGHRLPLSLDGVLLMSETLVFGSTGHVHVRLPGRVGTLVLHRCREGLAIRGSGKLVVNGSPVSSRANLGKAATVSGDDFTFTLEPVGDRLGRR